MVVIPEICQSFKTSFPKLLAGPLDLMILGVLYT